MTRRIRIGIIVLAILIAAGGGGYWVYTRFFSRAQTRQTPTMQTGVVTRGDIVITADGSGNLLPSTERALAFRVSGTLAELKVKVGDKVKAGDVLAKLDTVSLDNTLREATAQLEQARLALDKTQRNADSGTDLAIAAKSLEAARLGIINAQGSYSSTLLTDITTQLQQAKFWDDYWQSELGDAWLALQQNPNSDNRKIHYEDMGTRAAQAHANYQSLQQEADNNKTAAQRSLISAQQAYLSALSSYNDLKYSDPVKEAELTVLQNEIKVTQAQMDLKNATLIAPVAGTITAVSAEVGDSVGSASIVTLDDLDTPLVRFYVEESDLDKVMVGNRVNFTFEAWQDRTFNGKIIRVDPVLVTEGNTQAVQAWASVDKPSQGTSFYSGMSTEVEVVAQETRNAVLAPLGAVRELAPGQPAAFVVKDDGQLELRLIKVGLKDFVNAEILSGLAPGEAVSVGTETSSAQSTRSTRSNQTQFPGGPPGGGPVCFEGPGGGSR